MILKKAQYDQAVQLRRRGFTYTEIARIAGVSKSTVSQWFSSEAWSQKVSASNASRASQENSKRISLLNKARSNQNKKLYTEAVRSAETEYKHYKKNPKFVAGLMLYASNGDMSEGSRIRMTSAKQDLHRIFIAFAEEYLGVPREKVHFWLLLYPAHAPEACSRQWSKKIKLPLSHFHKYQVVPGSSTAQTLHFGTGNTIIGSTILKRKLLKWIELAMKDL